MTLEALLPLCLAVGAVAGQVFGHILWSWMDLRSRAVAAREAWTAAWSVSGN